MPYLMDEVARVLAGPASRRKALQQMVKVFAGVALLGLGKRAEAASCSSCCSPSNNCPAGQICCTPGSEGNKAVCASVSSQICCGAITCPKGNQCVNGRCVASPA